MPDTPDKRGEDDIEGQTELTLEEEDKLAWRVAQQSDEKAAIRLYTCHVKGIYHFFYRRTGDVSVTEELTEEAFCRAMLRLKDGKWQGQLFRALLIGISRHVFHEWLRAKMQRPSHESYETVEEERIEEPDPLEEILVREKGCILWGLVKELPEPDQRILALRYIHNLRYAEIAKLMDRTEKACKTLHYRALEKLRAKVVQAHLEDEFGIDKGKHSET